MKIAVMLSEAREASGVEAPTALRLRPFGPPLSVTTCTQRDKGSVSVVSSGTSVDVWGFSEPSASFRFGRQSKAAVPPPNTRVAAATIAAISIGNMAHDTLRAMSDANTSPIDPSKVWYLQRNRFFTGSVDGEIEANAHIFTVVAYPRRTLIFDQGDPTRLVYFIKRGTVRIARLTEDGKEVTVAVLGPGDMFGVESLFVSGERTSVAVAVDDVLLCTAKADDLFGMLRSDPQLAINVAKILSDRLSDAASAMQDLAYARVSDRLMGLFRRLATGQ